MLSLVKRDGQRFFKGHFPHAHHQTNNASILHSEITKRWHAERLKINVRHFINSAIIGVFRKFTRAFPKLHILNSHIELSRYICTWKL